jgi:hypothetical protein
VTQRVTRIYFLEEIAVPREWHDAIEMVSAAAAQSSVMMSTAQQRLP